MVKINHVTVGLYHILLFLILLCLPGLSLFQKGPVPTIVDDISEDGLKYDQLRQGLKRTGCLQV